MEKKTIYDYSAQSLQKKEIEMSTYKGKVILIVNTASKCGLTPQYKDLEQLYQDYKDKGLVILGFPCNQFGKQEPDNEEKIAGGCLLNYGVSFPMFAKIDVNGEAAHPLYKFLKSQLKGTFCSAVKWNFSKFLVNKEGVPYKRFSPLTKPNALRKHIEKLLAE